jgi:hypothetical protein
MPVRGQAARDIAAAALVAAVLAALWVAFGPRTPDLAAQVFRAEFFAEHGFELVNLQWYGGHLLPGYSLVFPPLAALLGERVVGALAAVASAALFAALAHHHFGRAARAGALLFAAGTAAELLIGRLTFALGTAFGLAALLAIQRDRRVLAVVLAIATTAASPVAGLFLALASLAATGRPASALTPKGSGPWPGARGLAPAGAAVGAAVLLAVAFPGGGTQSWGSTSFLLALGCVLLVLALLPRDEPALRWGVALAALA